MNYKAVDSGIDALNKIDVPDSWKSAKEEVKEEESGRPEFVRKVADVMNRQQGDKLPVSAFVGRENGEFPNGTSAYEKRGIAVMIPEWQIDNCIQCNQCSLCLSTRSDQALPDKRRRRKQGSRWL